MDRRQFLAGITTAAFAPQMLSVEELEIQYWSWRMDRWNKYAEPFFNDIPDEMMEKLLARGKTFVIWN